MEVTALQTTLIMGKVQNRNEGFPLFEFKLKMFLVSTFLQNRRTDMPWINF